MTGGAAGLGLPGGSGPGGAADRSADLFSGARHRGDQLYTGPRGTVSGPTGERSLCPEPSHQPGGGAPCPDSGQRGEGGDPHQLRSPRSGCRETPSFFDKGIACRGADNRKMPRRFKSRYKTEKIFIFRQHSPRLLPEASFSWGAPTNGGKAGAFRGFQPLPHRLFQYILRCGPGSGLKNYTIRWDPKE